MYTNKQVLAKLARAGKLLEDILNLSSDETWISIKGEYAACEAKLETLILKVESLEKKGNKE